MVPRGGGDAEGQDTLASVAIHHPQQGRQQLGVAGLPTQEQLARALPASASGSRPAHLQAHRLSPVGMFDGLAPVGDSSASGGSSRTDSATSIPTVPIPASYPSGRQCMG